MRYEITFSFDTKPELELFLKDYKTYEQWKYKKATKTQDDGRGKSTKHLHEVARKLKEDNPEKLYKQCLKEAGQVVRLSSQLTLND